MRIKGNKNVGSGDCYMVNGIWLSGCLDVSIQTIRSSRVSAYHWLRKHNWRAGAHVK